MPSCGILVRWRTPPPKENESRLFFQRSTSASLDELILYAPLEAAEVGLRRQFEPRAGRITDMSAEQTDKCFGGMMEEHLRLDRDIASHVRRVRLRIGIRLGSYAFVLDTLR